MTQIPDFMPILSAGAHPKGPQSGACIMEYASFLNGEKWGDSPSCTHPLLALAARLINDELDNEERQRLLPLLPRLMGTTGSGAESAIREAARKYVEHLAGHHNRSVSLSAEFAAKPEVSSEAVVWEAEMAVALTGGDLVDYLSTLIDAYDVATGRTAPATVTEDDLRRCGELTGASR